MVSGRPKKEGRGLKMAFEKVERNLRRLRRMMEFEGAPRRWRFRQEIEPHPITPTLPEEIKEATRRFVRAFFRARGFLPENPLAAKDELRKAIGEMEIIKQVLVPEDYEHIKTMLSEIEDFLGKHEIESAIAKMEALWTWMLTKVFPPPPYIASPFPLEMKGSWVQIPRGPESKTLELKQRHGSELRRLIEEAQAQNREVGVMLCQTEAGDLHLSRECWGRRETVTVADCHDGLSPLGSFHAHLSGTGIFSVPDLDLAIKKEQLSCLGYVKAGVPTLKCILPKRYYELPYETRTEIRYSLDQARQDIERAIQLYKTSPSHPEAIVLSKRAQVTLSTIERILGVDEVPL